MQGTWESSLTATYFGLYDGGTAGVIWMMIIVWLCMIVTIACMAEMVGLMQTDMWIFTEQVRRRRPWLPLLADSITGMFRRNGTGLVTSC
jgi:hypothetical protein